MAKDHFLPASLIGRFSSETEGLLRKRKVWVHRRNGSVTRARAENVGFSNNLYDVDGDMFPTRGVRAVDDQWASYEAGLPGVLDRLIDGSVSAGEWIDTLVPFVAASFARDRGYKTRVVSRLEGTVASGLFMADPDLEDAVLDDTNIALNRIMEMERFAGRALASEWSVHELEADVVLPDLGYSLEIVNEDPPILGTYFPIGPRHILMLIPRPIGRILSHSDEGWRPCIAYCKNSTDVSAMNGQIGRTAQDFVVGAEESVRQVATSSFGVVDWGEIDKALAKWPFSTDTRELYGLYGVVRTVIQQDLRSVEGMTLDPYAAMRVLEPEAFVITRERNVPADQFLSIDREGLNLRVHSL